MTNKQRKTDAQLGYIARTTLSERINDFLFEIELNQATGGKVNPFMTSVPIDDYGVDVIWTDINTRSVR